MKIKNALADRFRSSWSWSSPGGTSAAGMGGGGTGLGSSWDGDLAPPGDAMQSYSHTSVSLSGFGNSVALDEEDAVKEVAKLLSSKSSRDQLEGARRAVAVAMGGAPSASRDEVSLSSLYFPAVVKAVNSSSPDVRRLVYLFLSTTAERSPNEALLAVNVLKNELDSPNALQRGMALRTLCNLRVPVISQLVVLAIRKGALDPSAYVRRHAATGLLKVSHGDREQLPVLIEVVETLLQDRNATVVGTALAAYNILCPERWEAIHPHYRKICRLLGEMDSWSQVGALDMLLRYVRTHFVKPPEGGGARLANVVQQDRPEGASLRVPVQPLPSMDDFYSDDENENADGGKKPAAEAPKSAEGNSPEQQQATPSITTREEEAEESESEEEAPLASDQLLQDDQLLLLRCVRQLLHSDNPAVVVAVAALMYHAAPPSEWIGVSRSLILTMRLSPHAAGIVLAVIARWATDNPELFRPYIRFFIVRSSDDRAVRAHKLQILTSVADESNSANLLKEFQAYLRHPDKVFVAAAVRAMGRCAARLPSVRKPCLRALLRLSAYHESNVADEAVNVMRILVQRSPEQNAKGVIKLLQKIDRVRSPVARAGVIWMIGGLLPSPSGKREGDGGESENGDNNGEGVEEEGERLPPEKPGKGSRGKALVALEAAAQRALFSVSVNFSGELEEVKLQMLTASTRLYLRNPDKMAQLHFYLLQLGRYDASFDVRDRARFLGCLVSPLPSPSHDADEGNNTNMPPVEVKEEKTGVETNGESDDGSPSNHPGSVHAEPSSHLPSSTDTRALKDFSFCPALAAHASSILFCSEPNLDLPPIILPRERFCLGSLSFMVRHMAPGYERLPDFPPVSSDASLRDPPMADLQGTMGGGGGRGEEKGMGNDFYDGSESDDGSYSSYSSDYSSSGGSETGTESDSDDWSEEDGEEEEEEEEEE